MRATRGAGNPNLQVVITHAPMYVASIGPPLRLNGIYRTQFDPERLEASLVI